MDETELYAGVQQPDGVVTGARYSLRFDEAIRRGLIADYRLLCISIRHEDVARQMQQLARSTYGAPAARCRCARNAKHAAVRPRLRMLRPGSGRQWRKAQVNATRTQRAPSAHPYVRVLNLDLHNLYGHLNFSLLIIDNAYEYK